MTPTEIALAFVDAINSKNLERLAELMTDDHKYIDGDGSEHVGKDRMKDGWKEHVKLIPDLVRFETAKGTIRFKADNPIPTSLIKRIVKARLKELEK